MSLARSHRLTAYDAAYLELALRLPHKVQGLVLVNGFSEFLLETPKEQERYAMRLKWLRWFGMRPLAWWLGRELFPGPDLAQVRHTFRLRFVRNKKKTYKALLEALPGWSVRARLGSLWQPVAIISTSHDYLPLAKRVEQFAALPLVHQRDEAIPQGEDPHHMALGIGVICGLRHPDHLAHLGDVDAVIGDLFPAIG